MKTVMCLSMSSLVLTCRRLRAGRQRRAPLDQVQLMRAVSSTDSERARLTDETRMLARLSHPGRSTSSRGQCVPPSRVASHDVPWQTGPSTGVGAVTHQQQGGSATDWGQAWFRVGASGHCVIVTAGGEIDMRTAVGLARAVDDALSFSPMLVFDLSLVTFMDSTGLGVLIAARNRTRDAGGSVSLVHPPDLVRKILAGTRLHEAFDVFTTLEEALAARDAR
jgi:anti-sigma B factor antagonist